MVNKPEAPQGYAEEAIEIAKKAVEFSNKEQKFLYRFFTNLSKDSVFAKDFETLNKEGRNFSRDITILPSTSVAKFLTTTTPADGSRITLTKEGNDVGSINIRPQIGRGIKDAYTGRDTIEIANIDSPEVKEAVQKAYNHAVDFEKEDNAFEHDNNPNKPKMSEYSSPMKPDLHSSSKMLRAEPRKIVSIETLQGPDMIAKKESLSDIISVAKEKLSEIAEKRKESSVEQKDEAKPSDSSGGFFL